MQYGIRFIYISGVYKTEIFFQSEVDRNESFEKLSDSDWACTYSCGEQIINLSNVAYCEKIER